MNHLLTRADTKDIDLQPHHIMAISTARNEITRLPFWFDYYRSLGVHRFFMVDDHSTDGTTGFLLAQPDTYVFTPLNSYSESNVGTDWQNALLDAYGVGRWTLVADSDELLVYKNSEHVPLPAFCASVEADGSDAVFCFLLDMYPQGNLSDAVCKPGKPFYDICDHFDSDYEFTQFPDNYASRMGWLPQTEVIGGPRMRKFYPEQRNTHSLNRRKNRLVWKFCNLAEKLGVSFPDKPHHAPTLFKVPLVKWQPGYARLSGHHILPVKGGLSPTRAALLHFKFFADFHDKAKLEVVRGEHYAGGQEYNRYLRQVAKTPDLSFMYPGSVKYTGTADLERYGLISA